MLEPPLWIFRSLPSPTDRFPFADLHIAVRPRGCLLRYDPYNAHIIGLPLMEASLCIRVRPWWSAELDFESSSFSKLIDSHHADYPLRLSVLRAEAVDRGPVERLPLIAWNHTFRRP